MNESRSAPLILVLFGLVLASGCQRVLPSAEYLARYEKECAVQMDRNGIRFLILYQSFDYLAARIGGDSMQGQELASLHKEYGNGQYVRITLRPVPDHRGITEADLMARQFELGQRLMAVQGELGTLIKLQNGDGDMLDPIAISVQKGAATGAPNTILAIFPNEFHGRKVDIGRCELVIDEFGLNLGTLRTRLARPKGFRLKVAA
jgi:hypothetical protein